MVLWDVYSEFQPGVLGTQLPKQDRRWEPAQDIDSFHLVQNRGSKTEEGLFGMATWEWMREGARPEEDLPWNWQGSGCATPNGAPWEIGYFKLKECEKQQIWEGPLWTSSMKLVTRPSGEVCALCLGEKSIWSPRTDEAGSQNKPALWSFLSLLHAAHIFVLEHFLRTLSLSREQKKTEITLIDKKGNNSKKVKVKSLSPVRLFGIPWTVAHQVPPSMQFSRQKYWSGLPFPSPGDLPNTGIEPGLPHCGQTLYHLSHCAIPWNNSKDNVNCCCLQWQK